MYNLSMNNLIYIDSSKVRNNFSSILNSVFKNKKTYVIRKSGIPVAKISYIEEVGKKDNFINCSFIPPPIPDLIIDNVICSLLVYRF